MALRIQVALLSPLRALERFLAAELGKVAVAFVLSGPNPKSTKKISREETWKSSLLLVSLNILQ